MSKKQSFRDILYDKNDILIALLIIAAAIILIGWRVHVVMDYPSTLDSVATAEKIQSAAEEEGMTADSEEQEKAEWKDGKLAKDLTVNLSSDSTEAAINSLVAAGVFKSAKEFKYVCKQAGVSDADIKTGGFTFEKGFTKKKIAKGVTK